MHTKMSHVHVQLFDVRIFILQIRAQLYESSKKQLKVSSVQFKISFLGRLWWTNFACVCFLEVRKIE